MNLAPILQLLEQRTGLEPSSLGSNAVEAILRDQLRRLGVSGEVYAARLAVDPGEFARLVGEVVVPETWFFRGGELFAHLTDLIRATLLSRTDRPYRALSIPCSTGEEPYSLAIALAEAGIAVSRRTIVGIDLSPRNIDAATRGRYREFSFRQTTPELRRRYFSPIPEGWELDPALRASVRFQVGNLLDPALLLHEPPFDLVLCRNLFIYFGPEARAQGLNTLARLVAPGGLLGLGHVEPLDLREQRFTRIEPIGYFLYRRAEADPTRKPPSSTSTPTLPRREQPSPLPAAPPRRAPSQPAPVPALAPPRNTEVRKPPEPTKSADPVLPPLDEARLLADAGRYDEALTRCRDLEARIGPSAKIYTLRGTIHQARRELAEAIRHFNKALYLDPDCRDALFHLMLLHQQQGAGERADTFRRRLERLSDGGDDA